MENPRLAAAEIPAGAAWNDDEGVWELVSRGASGERQGESRRFRADGSLLEVRRYEADVPSGPFTAHHPDGTLARRGTYAEGQLHGALLAYASDAPAAEPLAACCVPESATELRALYAHGHPVREVFHDWEGRPLLLDGSPWPARPAGVDDGAELHEGEGDSRWVSGQFDSDGNRAGWFRFWTLDGLLVEESEYSQGRASRTRRHDGELVEDCGYDDEDLAHGAYRQRFSSDDNPYADERIREERGTYDHGRRVGVWTYLDGGGEVIGSGELGLPVDETELDASPAFAAGAAPDLAWDLVDRLLSERRVREALCAAAVASAARNEADRLSEFLARHTPRLKPAIAARRGQEVTESGSETPTSALEALATGADAAAAFRCLASVLDTAHPAALAFANASLLLAPDRTVTRLTRALIRIEQGDDRGALADATALEAEMPEAAHALRAQVRLTFPDFLPATGFWPARESLTDAPAGGPDRPARDLAAIRRVVQVYATRLRRLRAHLASRVGAKTPTATATAAWWPPDVGALLPDGPVELAVDEQSGLPVEDEPADGRPSIADLLLVARADWSALSWLCWAVGLDRVALPQSVAPPNAGGGGNAFGAAMAMVVARCLRAHDRVLTGGARARAQGLPGFTWQGVDIDELPPHLARLPAAEYLEIRSMFLWLVLPDAGSPFQSDLRDA